MGEPTFCALSAQSREREKTASSDRGMSTQSSVEDFVQACWSAVSFVAKSCWTDFFLAVSKAHFSNLSVVNDNSLLFSFTLCQNRMLSMSFLFITFNELCTSFEGCTHLF